MALEIHIIPHTLKFKFQAKTSRGSLNFHKTWYIKIWDSSDPEVFGIGECAPFEGLSIDDVTDFDSKLESEADKIRAVDAPRSVEDINEMINILDERMPAAKFGFEIALRDLFYGGARKIFESPFINDGEPIPINGLVWMGDKELMMKRLEEKIEDGFSCIKIKIGAINWQDELDLIRTIRSRAGGEALCVRVDANGAFDESEIKDVLISLKELNIHSIEQPIKAGKINEMREICSSPPVPIALDEELIGIHKLSAKKELLESVKPQFIVLKPTLLGGFNATREWINLADELNIGWWLTSALESNIGLNAICQFASLFNNALPQGLGTGGLYHNNISSPLTIKKRMIYSDASKKWQNEILNLQ